MDLRPVVLTGRVVRLEPLSYQHTADLLSTGKYRDSVFYSVIDSELPAVHRHLTAATGDHRQE